jgi:glycyl-tRNA synthetase alpha subunit
MASIRLKAYYDGETIRLDEPFDLPEGAQLMVTVLEPAQPETDRAGWIERSKRALERAYGDSEPEYSIADILP